MARQGKMDHKLDDKGRCSRQGNRLQVRSDGENVGHRQRRRHARGDHEAWMESKGPPPPTSLEADYTEIGVGIARARTGRLYFTQVFAKPWKIDPYISFHASHDTTPVS